MRFAIVCSLSHTDTSNLSPVICHNQHIQLMYHRMVVSGEETYTLPENPTPRHQPTVTAEELDALSKRVDRFVAENEVAALTLSRLSSDFEIALKATPLSLPPDFHGIKASFEFHRVSLRDLRDRQKPFIEELRCLGRYHRTKIAPLWTKLATSVNAVGTALESCRGIREHSSVIHLFKKLMIDELD